MKNILLFTLALFSLVGCAQDQELEQQLAAMLETDQLAAFNATPPPLFSHLTQDEWVNYKDSIYRVHKKTLERILDDVGFPGFEQVGEQGSFNFWVMVQHCDFDPAFQLRVLDSMAVHVKKGNASPSNFAYLTDRYNLNNGEQQIYGTQVTYDETGKAIPKQPFYSDDVNKRRKENEMETLEEYLNKMSVQHYEMNKINFEKRGIVAPSLHPLVDDSSWTKGKLLSRRRINIQEQEFWGSVSSDGELLPRFSFLDSLNCYEITYQSDNEVVTGFYIEPKVKEKVPVIIFNRGGNMEHGRLSVQTLLYSTGKLASQGYCILASNYRDNDEFGGRDVQDVLSLITLAGEFERIDTTRVGMFGWSRGGMMTYLAVKNSDLIKTAVVGNGVADLKLSAQNRPKLEKFVYAKYIPNYSKNKEAELEKRSVIYWTDQLKGETSFLLLCGSNDKRVESSQSINLAKKLKSEGKKCEIRIYETGHTFGGFKDELDSELIDWFKAEL